MSFPVYLCSVQKRENSTKRPTTDQINDGFSYNCLLLDNTSMMNPTFKISMENVNWIKGYLASSFISAEGKIVMNASRNVWYFPCIAGRTYNIVTEENWIYYAVYTTHPAIGNQSINNMAREGTTDHTVVAPYTGYLCFMINKTSNTPQAIEAIPDPIIYNYCYVPEFRNRYYFINDISSDNRFWYISCTCDVLATYRPEILGSSHYVLRSASAYDEYISDPVYPAKIEESGTQQAIADPFAYTNGHSYVWCVTGNVINGTMNNQQIGSNVYYWMSDLECYTFISKLLDVQDYSDIQTSEYSAAMQQALLNPIQYVNSVVLLPFSKDTSLATNNHIKFGYYDIEIVAAEGTNPTVKRLTQGTMVKHQSVTCSIPKHPQAATRGKYMNSSPYTTYELFLGPFGTIPLDPASLVDETTLEITYRMELATGMCQIFVGGSSSGAPIIYTGSAQVGAMVSVSQLTKDYLGEVKNQLDINTATGGALASIALGGLGAAGGVSNSIMQIGSMAFDAVRYRYPTVSGGGVNGSFLGMHSTSYLQARFYNVVDQNNTEIGRPLYQTKTLSTLSGFALCSGADVAITGTSDEAVKVNSYLNSGFYIE